jgi:hypothetical protein
MLETIQPIPSILATAFVGSLLIIFCLTALLWPFTVTLYLSEYGRPWIRRTEARALMAKHAWFRILQHIGRALMMTMAWSGFALLMLAIVNQRYAL